MWLCIRLNNAGIDRLTEDGKDGILGKGFGLYIKLSWDNNRPFEQALQIAKEKIKY